MYRKILVLLISAFLLACASTKNTSVKKRITSQLNYALPKNHFAGLLVYDPGRRDTLYNYNGEKYFTPASNAKIFTLYTALKLLPDRLPSLKYHRTNDTLFVTGTGDPTLLHPYFGDITAIAFLKKHKNIVFNPNSHPIDHFGPGWAWEDFDSHYAVERSAFPIYGNVVKIHWADSLQVYPSYFKEMVVFIPTAKNREMDKNIFYFDRERKDTLTVPFVVKDSLIAVLLKEAAQRDVTLARNPATEKKETLYGMAADTVYQRMMYESDNFLAEQMLIMASSALSDTLDGTKAQQYMLDHYLADLKQPPRWVDGSGLSRYNLFTPESMVHVLYKMYSEFPRERILNLFPVVGVSGTLKNWGNGSAESQLYAKSGSLGNNYCLSGYLLTKSGKTLIFSFMNNHFRIPNAEVKAWMQTILEDLGNGY